MLRRHAVALVTTSLLLAPSAAFADAYRVRDDGGSLVKFVSDAPLETIEGVSSKVSGSLNFSADDLSQVRGTVEVPVASLRTGVDLRDEHLRADNWLNARRFPKAKFEITSIQGARKLQPNRATKVKVRGRFTLHGVTRNLTAQATVRYIPLTDEMRKTPGINGDVLRVKAKLKLKLEDFKVSVPSIVRLKVANEIEVRVNLRAVRQRS